MVLSYFHSNEFLNQLQLRKTIFFPTIQDTTNNISVHKLLQYIHIYSLYAAQ